MAERLTNQSYFTSTRFNPRQGKIFSRFSILISISILLNLNRGRKKRPNFVIFVVWYTLFVGGLVLVGVLVACLGPAEIVSFVSLVLFKNAGRGESKISSLYF